MSATKRPNIWSDLLNLREIASVNCDGEANALSRRGEEDVEIKLITKPFWLDFSMFVEEVMGDPKLAKLIEELEVDPNAHTHYTLEQNQLRYKGRLVLPPNSVWIPKLLQEFHTTPTGGHFGTTGLTEG
ncbi:hypothetical protein CR513_05611, partial [Mucuna pruriens]